MFLTDFAVIHPHSLALFWQSYRNIYLKSLRSPRSNFSRKNADRMTSKHYSLEGKKIWIAGHRGMVGSAIMRRLESLDCEILTASRDELDLRRQEEVEEWMRGHRPQAVFLAAARVGGIHANNTYPADFIYENLALESNVIHTAHTTGVEKLLFLGSACIYPRLAEQPMKEEALLTGSLEPTNEWYAIAKISGIKMCQAYSRQYGSNFISAQPNNLYGPGDNFDLKGSHVIPALMAKAHMAKEAGDPVMEVWGSGKPYREFLFIDDLADALVFLMEHYSDELHINVGTGEEFTIADVAHHVAEAVGFEGELVFNTEMPDGVPRKLVDSSRLLSMGWKPETTLRDGLKEMYAWYCANMDTLAANRGGANNQ